MAIPGLTIIGESINDSVPSTRKFFDENDIPGLLELARAQDEKGASWIDVNVGSRPPEFMADLVRRIQSVTAKPLSIDTPDPAIAEAGLRAYDPGRAGGRPPILNSISPLRTVLFDLYAVRPFLPILMSSERLEPGAGCASANRTAEDTRQTARWLLEEARRRVPGFANSQAVIDPGIAPVGGDCEGQLKRVLESLALIHDDPFFAGVHMSVGLSNFTVMLPSKTKDGAPVKGPLESAFLTLAMPRGLDTIIGSTVRKYEILPAGHPALRCLEDILKLEGVETLIRLKEFYG
ncbi:MAG TPA: dihydropteroate synthase [Candidatus Aminicenantes bacterium]|nr:dihydropteroate synthase [Candidatus Aminicenantes bacterium]HRY64834.1 dihydropteroate synthase [Candidatus Aminicenantes bacterium]HRZ71747.1 dihydropteroate synthase [Candidatus Aminicenantes bacterium]